MAEAIVLNDKFEDSKKTVAIPAKYDEINSHNLYLFNKANLAKAMAGKKSVFNYRSKPYQELQEQFLEISDYVQKSLSY